MIGESPYVFAIDEIEGLMTGLQSKIWQKIRLLERADV